MGIKYADGIQDIGLIKWPQFVVVGKTVTEKEAVEILIRTDCHMPDFHYAGNDRGLSNELSGIFGTPIDPDFKGDDWGEHYKKMQALEEKLGTLELGYLSNSYIVSSYIGGPHGWCDWNGRIGCSGYNIGKWPNVEEIAGEWALIAEAFPYLDLTCWLFNHEAGCTEGVFDPGPVVKFEVLAGEVEVLYPDPKERIIPTERNIQADAIAVCFMPTRTRESGIEPEKLKEKIKSIYGEIPQYGI